MSEYRLPEQLDIRHIADAHARLLAALSDSAESNVALDASSVERIDTAGVQLLAVALTRTGEQSVLLRDPTPCVVEAFENLGISALLNS